MEKTYLESRDRTFVAPCSTVERLPWQEVQMTCKIIFHTDAELLLTSVRIKARQKNEDKVTKKEKKNSLITVCLETYKDHPLPCPKQFTVIKQYLENAAKNTTCNFSDTCDSFLISINTYFMSTVNEELPATQDIVAFVDDEATCNNFKEMMKAIRMLQ